MNRILLTTFTFVALSFVVTPEAFGEAVSQDESHGHHHGHGHAHHGSFHHGHQMDAAETAEEAAKKCEGQLEEIKGAGVDLPADKKAEFDYNLKIAGVEAKTLKGTENQGHSKKHSHSCHRHLKDAEKIVSRHKKDLARQKKAEERKASALARKAEREAAKAKREAEKAERAATHQHKNHEHEKQSALDHGRSEGASQEVPGADAAKPITEEKK